jgi:hypothetical protein
MTGDVTAVGVRDAAAVQTSFVALRRTVDLVQSDCREVAETLEALEGALAVVTQGGGGGGGQALTGFGLIGLPIAGALRAVKALASQYVKQQTGVALGTWTDFVTSASSEFQVYLAELDRASDLAEKQRQTRDGVVDATRVRKDLKVLEDIRWRTAAWKTVLGRVAQLGQVVDAILQVDLGAVEPEPGEGERQEAPSGFSGTLQRRLKDVQHRTTDRSGDLREWVLHPFLEVRDKVRLLPGQVTRLSHEVGLLELFLELEMAELRSLAGQVAAEDARIVQLRVAASVLLPELVHDLGEARVGVQAIEGYQRRLDAARSEGAVGAVAHERLSLEFQRELEEARGRLSELEGRADQWRRDGPGILQACIDWTTVELDVLAARRLAQQGGPSGTSSPGDPGAARSALLERERDRLGEARALLDQL